MALRIDFAGASLPRVCTLPVNYRVVCLREAGGVLVLPHHRFVCQVHVKRPVGWISPTISVIKSCLYFARSWAATSSMEVAAWSVAV